MILSTASSAARAAGGRTWLSISGGAALRQKWFSTTPTHQADHIITFRKASSPELNQLLEDFRQKVILPTYLAPEQRRKIYNPRIQQYLRNDPVTMEIDGVVHKFYHINRVADLPNTRKVWTTAVKSMKTPEDFRNVRPLLEGCVRARRQLDPETYGLIIRRAAMHDSLHVVLDCIKAASKTGFRLNHSEHINELLTWIQWPAIQSGFEAEETKKALRKVSLVLDMIESDEMHKPTAKSEGAFPFHRDPQALAARLHMAAARAVHHRRGKDDPDGTVAKYAQELVTLWPEGAGLLDLQPDAAYRDKHKMRYLLIRSTFLWCASPVLNGLTLAAQVVDPALAMQLQNRADKVEAEVQTALASPLLKKGQKGLAMYNALFNRQAEDGEAAEGAEEAD